MNIDNEFVALRLPCAPQALAWEARAKIIWGDQGDEVQTWLIDQGIDRYNAERIVGLAVSERATAIRVKGLRDLVLGLLAGAGGAAVGLGAVTLVNLGLLAVPIKGLALLVAISFLLFMYGAHLTWRGLARLLGGAHVKGAVSDAGD
jgi:hypothetical protein